MRDADRMRRKSTREGEQRQRTSDMDMATLEKLLPGLIVTQNQKERVLLNQIESLQTELARRSLAFQQTLTHFQRRLQQLNSKKQEEIQAVAGDSDSGIGEEQLTVQLAVILHRQNGSLGFNVTGGRSSQQGAMDLIVSRVNPTGPAKGKLCLQDKIIKVNGVDVCGSTHDEVITIFKNAQEPLVVELLRQLPSPWPHFFDVATQTELSLPEGEIPLKNASPSDGREGVEEKRKPDDILDEDLLKYDIEFEEVTLAKSDSDTKLGLILCYADESDTDIFIGEVNPESVAGRDGRIRSGDQIIQVNGVDVRTLNQGVELFSSTTDTISVVVARPHLKTELDLDVTLLPKDEQQADFHDPLSFSSHLNPQTILEEADNEVECGRIEEVNEEEEEEDGNDGEDEDCTGVEKDSGVGKTDESTRNEESSEQESVKEWIEKSPVPHSSNSKPPTASKEVKVPVGRQKRQTSAIAKGVDAASSTLDKSEAVHMWVESTAHNSQAMGERLCLGMFLPPPPSYEDSDDFSTDACECCNAWCSPTLEMPPATSPTTSTVYTNQHNLARTIRLQQKLFRRALLTSSSPTRGLTSPKVSPSSTNKPSAHSSPPLPPSSALEWKIKKRSDGSRCIVRRPVRNRLLKERANRLAEQRGGMTTDDDAVSEFKVGRYWSKEERKRHLERARERHRHKEEYLRARNEGKEGQGVADGTKQADILELSRRKMMRVKGNSLFDDFTTIQEVLAHGSRTNGTGKQPHSLLSVTTV